MTNVRIKSGDWVRMNEEPAGRVGMVIRVAKDNSWVDVDWRGWTKRQKTAYLHVVTMIPFGKDMEVTDLTREAELHDSQARKETE